MPPSELLEDCPETIVDIKTNGDLVRAYEAAKFDLYICNIDKAALRTWRKGITDG